MWFLRRVLSGKKKVRIGEIGRLPLYSAALGEHIVHRAEPICAPSASRLRSTSILYTEPVHRAEPICAPSGAEVHTDRVSASLDVHIVHRAEFIPVHRAEPRCTPTASRLRSTSILYTEPAHRAEPLFAPSGADMHTDRVSASLDEHIVHRAEPRCQYFCFSTNAFINAMISAISCFVRFNFSDGKV